MKCIQTHIQVLDYMLLIVAASFCSCSVVSSNDVGIIVATGYQIDLVNLFCCFRLNIDARHIQESVFTVGYKAFVFAYI